MTGFDLLILAIYWICVVYVLYQAANSLDDQFTVLVDQTALDDQLQEQELQNQVVVRFGFRGRYKFDELKEIFIIIANRSERASLYLDWDHCSLTDFTGRSRRVLRIPSAGMTTDLLGFQVFGIVAPSQSLQERLTAEDILKKTETGLAITGPLFDINRLQKGSEKDRTLYAAFMEAKADLPFSLRLAMRISVGSTEKRVYLLCKFQAHKLPWTDSLPWNQKSR